MATPAQHPDSRLKRRGSAAASVPFYEQWNLEDDRILIDIETEMAIRSHMESKTEESTHRIPHFLFEARTLGPLSVLFILALYSLLSPLLSPAVHEYIYHILH